MHGILESFNIKSYKVIAKQPFKKSLKFIVIFFIISSAVVSLRATLFVKAGLPQFKSILNKNLEYISADFPEVEIKNSELILPVKLYIKEWKTKFALIIDPAEENTGLVLEKYSNVLFFGRKKIMIKTTEPYSGKSKLEIYKLEKIGDLRISPIGAGLKITTKNGSFNLTPIVFEKLLKILSFLFWPVFFLWFFFIYCITKPVQILFFSLFSLLLKANLKVALSYKELLNIGIYAMVPPAILAVIKELLSIQMPSFLLIYSTVYAIYLFQGINENKEPLREGFSS